MKTGNSSVELKRRASAIGFDAVGIASLEPDVHAADLDRWLDAGYAGTMTYLHRQAAKRKQPQRILPGATVAPGARTANYVDAGPVPERELARRAGLGWTGKNTMLIDPERGSFTFIGTVLTDADFAPDLPFEADRCGTCRACLDACPTDAFVAPHVLDARRCISYLTIEYRAAFTDEQQAQVGDWLFGCDVCQDVCPWNMTFARPTEDPELALHPAMATANHDQFLTMEDDAFDVRYGGTPFVRPGVNGLRRNAAAVRGNRLPP